MWHVSWVQPGVELVARKRRSGAGVPDRGGASPERGVCLSRRIRDKQTTCSVSRDTRARSTEIVGGHRPASRGKRRPRRSVSFDIDHVLTHPVPLMGADARPQKDDARGAIEALADRVDTLASIVRETSGSLSASRGEVASLDRRVQDRIAEDTQRSAAELSALRRELDAVRTFVAENGRHVGRSRSSCVPSAEPDSHDADRAGRDARRDHPVDGGQPGGRAEQALDSLRGAREGRRARRGPARGHAARAARRVGERSAPGRARRPSIPGSSSSGSTRRSVISSSASTSSPARSVPPPASSQRGKAISRRSSS